MNKLPKNVYQRGPSLYYVEYIGRERGRPRYKWHKLCPADSTPEAINGAIWNLKTKGTGTMTAVMKDYIRTRLKKRAATTRREYERVIKNKLIGDWGHMRPGEVTSQEVAMYLEHRERQGHGPAGNREIAVLSSVFNHGMRIGACKINPTYGVRRNEESPRTRYVTDLELRQALRAAGPALRYLMWGTYLTGFRQGDMRRMLKDHLTPDGIQVREGKGGKHEVRLWSESLRKVVRRALTASDCDRVFTNSYGQPWTKDAIQNAMRRLKGKTGADWTFHDLRAKAESDHKTGLGLMRRYTRARKLAAVK